MANPTSRIKWCDRTLDQYISPNVSISKEILRNEEGDSHAQKFTIGIDGYVMATGDPIGGARQNNIYEQINGFLGITPLGRTDQQGILEILPVDGGSTASGVLKFENAQLLSLDLPEAPEDTAGIQYQQYSFKFESYQPANSFDIFSGYRVKSMSENWEMRREDEKVSYAADDFLSNPKYTYTLTHTVSAVGIQQYSGGLLLSPAWNEAYKFVDSRLKEDITVPINKTSYNQNFGAAVTQFNLNTWKTSVATTGQIADDISSYQAYNKIRTATVDTVGGSYSATTTYQLSPSSGTYEINVKYDEGEDGEVSIGIDGNITPLSSGLTNYSYHEKLAVSSGLYKQLSDGGDWTKMGILATQALDYYKGYANACSAGLSIDQRPRAISVGQNRNNGTITFNLTYKGISSEVLALKQKISGAIAVSLIVSDDNPLMSSTTYKDAFQFNKVAVIDILGKADGPVIQDMGTTKERKKSVQLDVTMKQGCRTKTSSPASSCYPIVSELKPVNAYSQGFTEQWDWVAGKYSLNVEWIYT